LEAPEQASQAIRHAEDYADVLSRGAREEADAVLAEANGDAKAIMEDAVTQAEDHRRAAAAHIVGLESQRQALDSYLGRLRRLVSRDLSRR
jgi:vacuolar-type H+-ATPase subunit H